LERSGNPDLSGNQKGQINHERTETRKKDNINFVLLRFRVFVVKKFLHKMQRIQYLKKQMTKTKDWNLPVDVKCDVSLNLVFRGAKAPLTQFKSKEAVMKKYGCSVVILILLAFLAAASAHAGGLWLYEEATPDMGVAGAGRQAAAMDASTAGGNPAGMTRLDRSQMEGGLLGFYPKAKFKVQETNESGGGVGNAGNFAPSGSFYYVHSLKPDLKLGLGLGSYMGAGLDYGNNWAGRYYAEKVSLTTAAINPSVGYRVNPWLSMGGGVSIVYGQMSDRTAINTVRPSEPGDGRLKFDATDVGYGFNGGVLFEVSPQTRFGVTYASEVDLNFKDDLRFKNLDLTGGIGAALKASGILDSNFKVNWNIPQQVAVGAYQELTKELALVATLNWQDWSRFGLVELSVPNDNTVGAKLNWQDTYHVGLGAYYRVAEPWLLMAGWAYDTSPISSSKDRSPVLPVDRQFRYAAGVQYDWSKDFSVGAAYTLIDAGECKINKEGTPLTGQLVGKYDPNFIHAFNLNFVYRY
jgi:long-chain fatty acid transport protein